MFGFNVFSREFIGFWFTLALINAGLAQSKNKDGFVWFMTSVVLGPIATLLIITSNKEYDD